ncbi:MAG: hypothetical protein ACR2IK_21215 [Chloroflexota bacterium]
MTTPFEPLQASSRARAARATDDVLGVSPLSDLDAAGIEPNRASPPSTPRWVTLLGIIAIVLVLLFVGLHLTGHVPTHTLPFGRAEPGMQTP